MSFQISAPAVGMIRNGAIISVRMRPLPKTSELRSTATPSPMTTENPITARVRSTVFQIAVLMLSFVSSAE